jgi:hypothetical protein
MEYITQEFLDNKWTHVKNTSQQQVFEKNDREFAITNQDNKIHVSFPLLNSPYNFVAILDNSENFDNIYDYISDKIHYFEN